MKHGDHVDVESLHFNFSFRYWVFDSDPISVNYLTLRVRETSSLMPTRPKVKVKPHPGKYVVCGVQNCLTTVCLSGFDAHCKAMHASLSVEELNFCEIPAYPRQWRSMVTNDPAPPPRRSGRKLRRSVTAPKPIRPASNLIHFFESFVPEEVKNRSEGPDFKLKFWTNKFNS